MGLLKKKIYIHHRFPEAMLVREKTLLINQKTKKPKKEREKKRNRKKNIIRAQLTGPENQRTSKQHPTKI